ncbi:MAG TPA: DUF4241 domain-containing protein [Candidatus Limnocylindrales bacterium]|nr:DUF4241 domain-containing protein [Candidatus Limnocylindrales bacterium]
MLRARVPTTLKLRLSLFAFLVVACSAAPEPVTLSGDRDGLTLQAGVTNTGHSIAVDVLLRNERAEPVAVLPDQCGRVVDVELERTEFRPEGRQWVGSVQAVKDLVLADQSFLDRPDSFAPRRVGDSSTAVPACSRPDRLTTLEPGQSVAERWELPYDDSMALRELGSDATKVSVEAVEPRDPNELEFLDILPADAEDDARDGRVVRAELPLSKVLQRAASDPVEGPSNGELFDRLLQDEYLRTWIESQPADAWGRADLRPAYPGYGPEFERLLLKLVSKEFERAAVVTAEADGSDVVLELPDEDSRVRPFARTSGTLPPGITAIPDSDYALTDDLHIGEVRLPSGRVVVGEYLDEEPLPFTVAPGAYPAHATLARYRDYPDDVAFLTLVLSESPTVRWQPSGAIAVDGGTATLTSVEGRDELLNAQEAGPLELSEAIFDSMVAHDYLATEWELTPETNLVRVSSGVGDGGYPVYVGYDADGKPTRVVVDFYLLHLSWPDA